MANQGRGPGQGTDRRLTKAERKEQARLEREQIQRQMAARSRNRRLGFVIMVLGVVIVVVVVFLLQSGAAGLPTPDALLADASAQASAAGCGSIDTTPNYGNAKGADPAVDHTHIGTGSQFATPPPLSSYPTSPPASGPHDSTPVAGGIYSNPPDIFKSIHSLEHAGTIIWYAPSAEGSDALKRIKDFYSQTNDVGQGKVIVAPYDYPSEGAAGALPSGIQMVLVAWHREQTCAQPNLAAAYSFTSQYNNATPGGTYIGVAREPNATM